MSILLFYLLFLPMEIVPKQYLNNFIMSNDQFYRLVITPINQNSENSFFSSGASNISEFYLDSASEVCKVLESLKDLKCFYSLANISVSSSDVVVDKVFNSLK